MAGGGFRRVEEEGVLHEKVALLVHVNLPCAYIYDLVLLTYINTTICFGPRCGRISNRFGQLVVYS